LVPKKSKRKRVGDWHHRVPDFKLVYCGSKKNILTKEKSDKKFKKEGQIQKALQQ
jgi:hypothetical protein